VLLSSQRPRLLVLVCAICATTLHRWQTNKSSPRYHSSVTQPNLRMQVACIVVLSRTRATTTSNLRVLNLATTMSGTFSTTKGRIFLCVRESHGGTIHFGPWSESSPPAIMAVAEDCCVGTYALLNSTIPLASAVIDTNHCPFRCFCHTCVGVYLQRKT
jgi:hypothetical protein